MDTNTMTMREFLALAVEPVREGERLVGHALIILPHGRSKRELHDSGYRCMDVIVEDVDTLRRLGAWSDVIHIEGIGGYGEDWRAGGTLPTAGPLGAWSIDCLATSGLCRLFPGSRKLIVAGTQYSSLEVYSVREDWK